MIKNPTVLDLFCGCGGLSFGFEQAGFDVKYGIDNCQDSLKSFKFNHKKATTISTDLNTKKILGIINENNIRDIDVIIGGPPCQGFSIAGKRVLDDERNQLYKSFLGFIDVLKPNAFVMENVPNMFSMGKGIVKKTMEKEFANIGYEVKSTILLASEYGVPQNRKRAFLVGFKKKNAFMFPKKKNNVINVKSAISDLPDLSIKDGKIHPNLPLSNYQKLMRENTDRLYNHQLTNHYPKTVRIISLVPDGGNYKNLPKNLQQTRKVNIAWTRLNSMKPSFTIDTGHRHHFHYEYNRVPTVRESARIQSFPDDFIFYGTKTSQYRQVGNAVPPLLAKELASAMKRFVIE